MTAHDVTMGAPAGWQPLRGPGLHGLVHGDESLLSDLRVVWTTHGFRDLDAMLDVLSRGGVATMPDLVIVWDPIGDPGRVVVRGHGYAVLHTSEGRVEVRHSGRMPWRDMDIPSDVTAIEVRTEYVPVEPAAPRSERSTANGSAAVHGEPDMAEVPGSTVSGASWEPQEIPGRHAYDWPAESEEYAARPESGGVSPPPDAPVHREELDHEPVREAPVWGAEADEAPVWGAEADEAPVQEAPVQEAPVHEPVAHEAGVDEAPSSEEARDHDVPADDEPGDEVPAPWEPRQDERTSPADASAPEQGAVDEPEEPPPGGTEPARRPPTEVIEVPDDWMREYRAHEEPAHEEPAHEEPAHEEPAHEEPAHEEPAHEEAGAYREPAGDEPRPSDEPAGPEPAGQEPAHQGRPSDWWFEPPSEAQSEAQPEPEPEFPPGPPSPDVIAPVPWNTGARSFWPRAEEIPEPPAAPRQESRTEPAVEQPAEPPVHAPSVHESRHQDVSAPDPAAQGSTAEEAPSAAEESFGPRVLAVRCPAQHLNRPELRECRFCRRDIPPQEPIDVRRPDLGVLRLSTGDVIPLDRGVLLGRSPRLTGDQDPRWPPHLVRVPSPQNDISRTHVEVLIDGWDVVIRDLNSTNGTTLRPPGRPPLRLRPAEEHVIRPGAVFTLAEQVSVSFEPPTQ